MKHSGGRFMEEAHSMYIVLAVAIIATIIVLAIQFVSFVIQNERREQLRDLYDTQQDKFLNVYTKSGNNSKYRKTKPTKRKKN
jgi:heme/copper-type cytochrome/quinol oxidase subunit 2